MNEHSTRRGVRPAVAFAAAAAVLALAPAAFAAGDPALTCKSSKLSLAAKYGSCRLKADSKAAKSGDPVDYSKCSLAKFTDAESKATAGGGMCPTSTDESTVTTYMDDCTSRVATWLGGGGGLPDTCAADLAACEAEPRGQVPKTGQTICYDVSGTVISCAGTGQDGQTQKGIARSYTDNGDGTITDNNTGLMWEKLADNGLIHDKDTTYTWTNAFGKIATLNSTNFAGYSDWRLPSVMELQSIVNFGAVNPSVNTVFNSGCVPTCTELTCSCTRSDFYWSSTSYQYGPNLAWIVTFNDGFTYADYKTGGFYVRAVRAGS